MPPQVVGATFESPIMAIDPSVVGIGYVVNYKAGSGFSYDVSIGMELLLYLVALVLVIFFRPFRERVPQPAAENPEPLPDHTQ